MSRCCPADWQFTGDPAPLARDNIKDNFIVCVSSHYRVGQPLLSPPHILTLLYPMQPLGGGSQQKVGLCPMRIKKTVPRGKLQVLVDLLVIAVRVPSSRLGAIRTKALVLL